MVSSSGGESSAGTSTRGKQHSNWLLDTLSQLLGRCLATYYVWFHHCLLRDTALDLGPYLTLAVCFVSLHLINQVCCAFSGALV